MKDLGKFFVLMIGVGLFLQRPVYADNEKFAYVDVAKIFDEYQRTKDNDKTLQEAGKKKEQQRGSLVEEIKQMKDEIALASEEAKAKKEEALESKVRELQDFDRDAKRALGAERDKVVRQIFKDIDDTVQRYGKNKGLDFVFNERAFVYHNSKYDVTQDLLTELNKNYSKQKK